MKTELGKHVLLDCKGDLAHMSEETLSHMLSSAAEAAGATILSCHFHQYSGAGGITGVLILAESHISVHTWPEYDYAAFDIFMCGESDVEKAIDIIRAASTQSIFEIKKISRGISASNN